MTHIVVDPVTRIEGHLRIEAEVEGGRSPMPGRLRPCSAASRSSCAAAIRATPGPSLSASAACARPVHAIASIRAVENAIGAEPPPNARLLRNLIMAAQMVQDHVIHFYHLHALDWVDVVSAPVADPAKTSALAQSISDWPLSSETYFKTIQGRLKTFVDRGQLGPSPTPTGDTRPTGCRPRPT